MTDTPADAPTDTTPTTRPWESRLAEWKVQLLALAAAPFFGIGFVFDFLLRAKDFPELASAMWGVFGLFVGLFVFFLSLFGAGAMAAALGDHEKRHPSTGWRWYLNIGSARLFMVTAALSLIFIGWWAANTSALGLRSFVTPYVEWLKLHGHP